MALRTRSAGTPPFRAMATPQCMWSSSGIECASGLMLMMQPNSSAAWCQRQSRSSRHGCALISTATSCLAQALAGGAAAQQPDEQYVQVEEIEVDPLQLDAYRAAVQEQIDAAIRK